MKGLDFLLYSIILISGVFGIFLFSRLLLLWRTHGFYLAWLLSDSIMMLMFFFVRNGTFDEHPFTYRAFSPLFAIGPGFLFLFFISIHNIQKSKLSLLLHWLPVIILIPYTFLTVYIFNDDSLLRTSEFQSQILFPHYDYTNAPYRIEEVLYIIRTVLAIIYVGIIEREFPKKDSHVITAQLRRLFEPVRKHSIIVFAISIIYLITRLSPNLKLSPYYSINLIFILGGFMFMWHIILVLKDIENPNSIFRIQPVDAPVQLKINEESQFILKQIYLQNLYLDPLLSVEKVAREFGMSEEKFSLQFNNNIPFSFSSYINYLRMLHFDKYSIKKYSKEANIKNAGFNNRVSYYHWEKRKNKLGLQIDPILSVLTPQNTSNSQNSSGRTVSGNYSYNS